MAIEDFSAWLGALFRQSPFEAERLLHDRTATQFLVAWSIFEAKCFAGFVKVGELDAFAMRIVGTEGFDSSSVRDAAHHFHRRYQNCRFRLKPNTRSE